MSLADIEPRLFFVSLVLVLMFVVSASQGQQTRGFQSRGLSGECVV